MKFKFSSGGKMKAFKMPSSRAPKLKDPAETGPFYIRGTQAGSKEEFWVSLALEKFEKEQGWGWDYQVPVRGGRRRRGGNVVDFLVYTPGPWTVLEPKGRYWHTGHHEDQQEMRNVCRDKGWNLIEWFTDETKTKEAVLSFLRKEFNI